MILKMTVNELQNAVVAFIRDQGINVQDDASIEIVWNDKMVGSQIQKRAVWQNSLFSGIEIDIR